MKPKRVTIEVATLSRRSGVDLTLRAYDGKTMGEDFTAYVDGTLACNRVPDRVREAMRLDAANAFLSSRREMALTRQEADYWEKVRHTTSLG